MQIQVDPYEFYLLLLKLPEIQPLFKTLKEMNNRKVSSLLIVDRNGKAKGLITERDLESCVLRMFLRVN
ncbi:MAG: CBS domain-containing protein [Nitrososphaerota archaeon]